MIQSFSLFTVVFAMGINTLFAQQKVVGGVDVDIKDYPWQVALTSNPNGSGFCGGSIIGDSWVLTAAHCVNNDSPSGLYIRGGTSSSFASGGDSYSVSQIIIHPNYSGNSYDFALIEINGEFEYGENMQKIDLIDESEIALGVQDGGVMSTITGWGTTSSGGSLADVLQMVEAPIVDNDVACGSDSDADGNSGQYFCSELDESMICAGDLVNGGEDACQGDSGGPLVVRSSDNSRWLLIGATSWGNGCADVLYPGVWAKVSHVLDWINDNAVVGELGGQVYGCTDSTAINFNPEATENDESCEYPVDCNGLSNLFIHMFDSFGDGWNGNEITLNDQSFTLLAGYEATETVCVDLTAECIEVTCDGGLWQSEVSWVIVDSDGNELLSGGAPFADSFGGDDCGPVYGCLDITALNYNELANTDDGSCLYPVAGCMDTLAFNFNPEAGVEDGSCIYPVPGCMDILALNFNPEATENDESCEYNDECGSLTPVLIEVGGGTWDSEISWTIGQYSGVAESVQVCLEDGCQIFNMFDSYGDGWNNASVNITGPSGELLLNGTLEGFTSQGTLSFGLNTDESCGPVYGCLDIIALNYNELANTDDGSCLYIYGCMDTTALNYDANSTSDDGSCLYPVAGCMDTLALNFNPEAVEEDGSCEYPINCDSLTSVLIEVGGGTYDYEISWTIGQYSGVAESVQVCLEDGCQIFNMFDSFGDGWNNASVNITGPSGELLLNGTLEGFTSQGTLSFGLNTDESCGPVYGCLDIIALNYNELANIDDGSCLYPVAGCMDTLALNFNPEAVEEDGSCEYPINCDTLTAILIEVGGGSWQNEVSWQLGPFSGVVGSTEACIEDGCYEFIMNDSWGDGWNGNIVTISTDNQVIVSGTLDSGSQGVLLFSYNADCGYISGCMESGAINYNPDAILDDGSCLYPIFGCTDTLAINVNLEATDDDGSCYFDYDILGCTDELALNYNTLATYDDGTCEFPCEEGYVLDCDGSGECHLEAWIGDGFPDCEDQQWNADLTCYDNDGGDCGDTFDSGCTDPVALNYNPEAIEDDGSCEYPIDCDGASNLLINLSDSYGDGWNGSEISVNGQVFTILNGSQESAIACADLTSECIVVTCSEGFYPSEVSWTISDIDGNELLSGGAPYQGGIGECGGVVVDPISGCIDPAAVNYNPDAILDDGSCLYPIFGCMDISALNYNPDVTVDDGSCEYVNNSCDEIEVLLTLNTEVFANEISWSILDASDNTLASDSDYNNYESFQTTLCLEEGASFTFIAEDSFGDGWNGAMVYIESASCELFSGGLETGQIANYDFSSSCDDNTGVNDSTAPWDILITGSNHTMVIDANTVFDLGEVSLELGDALGLFYTDDNGDLQCGGYITWTGENNAIAAQGNDSTTDEIDGFQSGENFVWMVWDESEGQAIMVSASYSDNLPNQGSFVVNGISAISSLSSIPLVTDQLLLLPAGWSNFSVYMLADNMDLAYCLSSIVENVVIAKDNEGNAYLPDFNFNGVGDVLIGQGYQVKLVNESSILMPGTYQLPEENPIDLTPGWNLIGYLRLESADASAVMADVVANDNLIIAKDFNGNAYLPEYNFNGIGDMFPTQGYQLKVNESDQIVYLSNDDSYRMSALVRTENHAIHNSSFSITDNNMTIVIEDVAWDIIPDDGAEIAAFDKDGNLVGASVYTSPVTVISVWGDDAMTASKDGMLMSEVVSFKLWTSNEVTNINLDKWLEGSSSYIPNTINIAGSIVTNQIVSVSHSIDRVLLKVVNVLGQEVTLEDQFKGEVLFHIYTDGSVEKVVK